MKSLSKKLSTALIITLSTCACFNLEASSLSRRVSEVENRIASLEQRLEALENTFRDIEKAPGDEDSIQVNQSLNTIEKRLDLLETEKIVYGPITVSNIQFDGAKSIAIVSPGETIDCSLDYTLDLSQQEFLGVHDLLVGFRGVAYETADTQLCGVWDSQGTAQFQLTAPLESGDYDIRITYRPENDQEEGINFWDVISDVPDSFATIGVLRVR